jgi:hypothetical protein
MQYGGFSAKIDIFCPMIFSDYRIFIAQNRHIANTQPLADIVLEPHKQRSYEIY